MIKGQCLCGAVKYRYLAEITETIICHCSDCRLAQGTAFAFNSPIQKQYFVLDQGQDALKEYFHTPKKARVFCQHCASPIYSYHQDLPEVIRLRLGTVIQGEIPSPQQEFYVDQALGFIGELIPQK